ncbi:MAP kinase-activated protein kinase 2 (Fragment) [Seminavis robusta]|uniref:non-specific serine/threonine protein kinase n=1 Tax=Seminavis robusta TaxID=568900 RepID=A0A9N8EIS9_9STRA
MVITSTTGRATSRTSLTGFEKRQAEEQLLDRIGGPSLLRAIVDTFYQRIIQDAFLAPFFDGVNMAVLASHQYKFLEALMAFASTQVVVVEVPLDKVQFLLAKHDRMFREKGLSEEHLDLVLEHLEAAFQEHCVDDAVLQEIMEVLKGLRPVFEERARQEQEKQLTLLAKLGGPSKLTKLIRVFYDRLLADPDLAFLFTGKNMERLKQHQHQFLEMIFTELPDDLDVIHYIGERHQHLFAKGLNETHFDLVLQHLLASLPKHLSPVTVEEIKATIGSLRIAFEANGQYNNLHNNETLEETQRQLQDLRLQNNLLLTKVATIESMLTKQAREFQDLKQNLATLTNLLLIQQQQPPQQSSANNNNHHHQTPPNVHVSSPRTDSAYTSSKNLPTPAPSTTTRETVAPAKVADSCAANIPESVNDGHDDATEAIVNRARRATLAIHCEHVATQQHDGKTLEDFYQINPKLLLGEGGYGKVFACTHMESGYERAVKILPKGDEQANQQVVQEFQTIQSLDNPNLIKVYDMFEDATQFYIVSDIYKGGDLFDVLEEMGTLAEEDVRKIMNTMLTCVNYCHQKNLVHRDIKPENVLLEEHLGFEDLKIIDFGLAATLEEKDGILHEGVGSLYYFSPQILEGTYTSKCDIWSVGVVAFILLTGCVPFSGKTSEATLDAIVQGKMDFGFDDGAWDGVSDEAIDFVAYLLSYDEIERPSAEQALKHPWLESFRSTALKDDSAKRSSLKNSLAELKHFKNQRSKLKNAACAIMSRLLSKEEKEKIDLNFRTLDRNCDGCLCPDDLRQSSKELHGEPMTDMEIDEVFQHVNLSRTGKITYSELAIAIMMEENMVDDGKMNAAFQTFDKENKGHISAKNIREVLGCGDDLDVGHVGSISFEEFKVIMMQDKIKQPATGRNKPSRTPRRGTLGIVESTTTPAFTKAFKRLTLL